MWDLIQHIVMNVPVPDQGSGSVLFGVENYLLSVQVPPKDALPHADVCLHFFLLQMLMIDFGI